MKYHNVNNNNESTDNYNDNDDYGENGDHDDYYIQWY